MNLKKGDKRRLLEPLTVRTAFSIGTVPAGEIIEIQQGADKFNNVLVHDVWMHGPKVERMTEAFASEEFQMLRPTVRREA